MTAESLSWPSDGLTPPDGHRWDLLVVGGGSAGLVAARTAAGLGASVLLVERDRPGGDCLWTGCVPSKALLSIAHTAAEARAAAGHGLLIGDVPVDFPAVMRAVRHAVAAVAPVDSPQALRAAGVRVAHGSVRFDAPATAIVDDAGTGGSAVTDGGRPGGTRVRFRQALVATGSSPLLPPIAGLAACDPLTSDTVWSLDRLPGRLLVLGGGSIGCELGQAFARLGARVSVVEAAPRLLPRENPDAVAAVTAALRADGVDVRTGVAVVGVRPGSAGWRAALADGTEIDFDRILVAVGRRPRTDTLGLHAAGVEVDQRGYVRVDVRLRTSNRRIWAAGDVTGHPQFTHTAGVHGSLAAANAVLGLRRRVDLSAMPRVTFTQPEVAAVGVDTADGRPGWSEVTISHAEVDRALAEDRPAGHTRLIVDRRDRVVGASIVGPRAGESLAEVVLAVRRRLRARDLAGSIHAYPTYGDGVWKAGIARVTWRLSQPPVRQVTAALVRVRRWWMSR